MSENFEHKTRINNEGEQETWMKCPNCWVWINIENYLKEFEGRPKHKGSEHCKYMAKGKKKRERISRLVCQKLNQIVSRI